METDYYPEVSGSGPDSRRASDRIRLMGLPIDCVTENAAVAQILASIRAGCGGWVATPNVQHLRILSSSSKLASLVSSADLIIADGMPLVWASKLQGTPLPCRVTGSALILSLTEAAARTNASIFLLGGSPGTAERAAKVMVGQYQGLKIAGTLCPPLGFEENETKFAGICDEVRAARPRIVYCCLGFPKQELVIQRLRKELPDSWFLGLGGSLSMVAGDVRRAPSWMQRMGLEWLWRLLKEPKRLAARYLAKDLPFAMRLLWSARQQGFTLKPNIRRRPTDLRVDSEKLVSN